MLIKSGHPVLFVNYACMLPLECLFQLKVMFVSLYFFTA